MREQPVPDADRRARNRRERLDAPAPRGLVGDRNRAPSDRGEKRGGEDGEDAVRPATDTALRALHCKWYEWEEADGCEDRPRDEEEPVAPVAPVQHEPADREDAVEDPGALPRAPHPRHRGPHR